MRRQYVILAFLTLVMLVAAGNKRGASPGMFSKNDTIDSINTLVESIASKSILPDSLNLPDSLFTDSLFVDSLEPDTTQMDSLQKAIYLHNKAIDDSIYKDSLNRMKKNTIESPVHYTSDDSMVYLSATKKAYLYGNSTVKYQNMDLASENVDMSMEETMVHATGVWADSTETELTGTPVFKMGQDTYESDTMTFNYKTKKGLIRNVTTEQEEGFMTSELSKRLETGEVYLRHGKYTTCDADDPDFYLAISRAKLRPGKDVVFGPAYLVVADVPLPLAIPYGFFPFSSKYSSGFIMPSYGDESSRGFYLKDGGYYFAISDKLDLKLIGEIYTKGSWAVTATTNYKKRYKYSGTFLFSYQDSRTSEKDMPDFTQTKSFKIQWSHRQDSKANPYSTMSASVNFATSSYERNNLNSMYNPQSYTQSTRTSSVSWSTTFSSIGLSLSTTANVSQNMRDSSLSMTLPDLNISISRFYPFKRKHAAGKERWYEKISVSYTGQISNSYSGKENQIAHSNLLKDWRNGWQHSVPISGNFTLFNYINLSPSLSFTDRTYMNKIMRSWDEENQVEVPDTVFGFYNVYNWSLSLSASTKLYGFFTPSRKIFGDKIQAIRHVITPSFSFSYAPDFSASRYGYYDSYLKTDADGNVSLVEYSPYSSGLYGVPGKGKTGSLSLSVDNNVEMKIRSDKDTTGFKKISLIDNFGFTLSYNLAAQTRPWSDLTTRLRLKLGKSYTFSMNSTFATYAYELDENGTPYVGTRTEYSYGRFGRFQGGSQNISYTINPEKLRKIFGGARDEDEDEDEEMEDDYGMDTDIESNIDDDMINAQKGLRRKKKDTSKAEVDDDGYMPFSMPWSLTFGYGITMRENTSGHFNTKRMRYPYKFTQTLNVSGNIRLAEGWNISFSSGYDFDNHKISMTTASMSRDLHCFSMTCSMVLAPYTSYNFTFRCNAATLADVLKYDKRSGTSNAVQWY
ncbi:MAG: LPS-assembly protein LptD [Prevotella sp.]|nr:LPS-assembly protein LptD [Prevotella sp.]